MRRGLLSASVALTRPALGASGRALTNSQAASRRTPGVVWPPAAKLEWEKPITCAWRACSPGYVHQRQESDRALAAIRPGRGRPPHGGPAGRRVLFGERQVVRFEHVGLRYGLGPEVLRDLTFRIDSHSFQFLTGPSGAGKTSLLRLLFLSLRPTRGWSRCSATIPPRSATTTSLRCGGASASCFRISGCSTT